MGAVSRIATMGTERAQARGTASVVGLVGRAPGERFVGSVAVVPVREGQNLPLESSQLQRDEDPPRALVLHGPDEALDDDDAAVLADRTEALTNPATSAPTAKSDGEELPALIGDDVPRHGSSFAGGAIQELSNCRRLAPFSANILRTVVAPRWEPARQSTRAILRVPIVGQSVLSRRTM